MYNHNDIKYSPIENIRGEKKKNKASSNKNASFRKKKLSPRGMQIYAARIVVSEVIANAATNLRVSAREASPRDSVAGSIYARSAYVIVPCRP